MKLRISLLLPLSAFLLSGCVQRQSITELTPTDSITTLPTSLPITSPPPHPINFTARFEIYTNGTKRIFTDPRYHNKSADVYLEGSDSSLIHVTKTSVTWADFFATLPMSLKKDCLVTGTKQTFCTNETSVLKFFINGVETPDASEKEIQPNDELRVEYSKRI